MWSGRGQRPACEAQGLSEGHSTAWAAHGLGSSGRSSQEAPTPRTPLGEAGGAEVGEGLQRPETLVSFRQRCHGWGMTSNVMGPLI